MRGLVNVTYCIHEQHTRTLKMANVTNRIHPGEHNNASTPHHPPTNTPRGNVALTDPKRSVLLPKLFRHLLVKTMNARYIVMIIWYVDV